MMKPLTVIRNLLRCRRGGVAVAMSLAIVPVGVAAGIGVDVGRGYLEKERLSKALDAATLAAGSTQGTDAQLQARFQKYFNANYGSGANSGAAVQSVSLAINHATNVLTGTATVKVDTTFMRLGSFNDLTIAATSEITRQTTGLELALVLDNTGSMLANNNIQAVRDSSKQIVEQLFGNNTANPNLKVSIVPYSASVNVGSIAPTIVTGSGATYDPNDSSKWKGCVSERNYPDDIQDTPPTTGRMWTRYWWPSDKNASMPSGKVPDNAWTPITTIFNDPNTCNNSTGPNLACPTPITPLTNDKTTLVNALNAMQAWCRGGTIGHVGMAWGWRTLSPNGPFTEGLAYNTPNWRKAAILMTDGDNLIYSKANSKWKSDYTAFGRLDDNRLGTTDKTVAKGILNTRLSEVCANMKAAGITIYTITFTSNIDAATKAIYRNCASDLDKYFDAPSQATLASAFNFIGTELSSLRVSK